MKIVAQMGRKKDSKVGRSVQNSAGNTCKMYPKSLKIVAWRGPKSKKIVIWRGLWVLPGMFGAIWSEFSTKLGTRYAKLGPRCSKLGPRWSIMVLRRASRAELGRSWGHLGPKLVDFGRVLGGLGEDFGGILGHGLTSKDLWFSFGF